jgi:hypothetical protein
LFQSTTLFSAITKDIGYNVENERNGQLCNLETHTATESLGGLVTESRTTQEAGSTKSGATEFTIHTERGFMSFGGIGSIAKAEAGCMKSAAIGFMTRMGNGWDRIIREG